MIAPLLLAAALAVAPLTFETHAAFFSTETGQTHAIDPQVFVAQTDAPAARGPQGIEHVAGIRPAFLDDPRATPVETADGKPLGFTLGAWLGATGTATVTPLDAGKQQVAVSFAHLVPGGRYSLFENHFAPTGVTFTPLDGTGTTNSFTAAKDGSATATVVAPEPFTHANAILLVYHSDGMTHGMERGAIGVSAHHQLIVRFP